MRRFQPQPILFLVFLLGATAPLPAQGPESGKPLPASEWDESDRSPGAGRIRLTAAELLFQFPPADVPPDEPDSTATVPAESMRADDSAESSNDNRFNPAVVAQGEAAFQRGCLDCHDAARSYEKTKTLSGWISTTRRMAAKDGADVPEGDIVPIATYLASRSAPGPGAGNGDARLKSLRTATA